MEMGKLSPTRHVGDVPGSSVKPKKDDDQVAVVVITVIDRLPGHSRETATH